MVLKETDYNNDSVLIEKYLETNGLMGWLLKQVQE